MLCCKYSRTLGRLRAEGSLLAQQSAGDSLQGAEVEGRVCRGEEGERAWKGGARGVRQTTPRRKGAGVCKRGQKEHLPPAGGHEARVSTQVLGTAVGPEQAPQGWAAPALLPPACLPQGPASLPGAEDGAHCPPGAEAARRPGAGRPPRGAPGGSPQASPVGRGERAPGRA